MQHTVATTDLTASARAFLTDGSARDFYRRHGYVCAERALEPRFCRSAIESLNGQRLIPVESRDRRGVTRFLTVNGEELLTLAPALRDFYAGFGEILSDLAGTKLVPVDNSRVGISLNYTPPGGGFVCHFDRNEFTVSLYLNEVEAGELSIWPNIASPLLDGLGRFRFPIALNLARVRKPVDIPPREGTLVVFSRRTAHAVAPVRGNKARVSVIMAFDRPGVSFMNVPDYYGRVSERVLLDRALA